MIIKCTRCNIPFYVCGYDPGKDGIETFVLLQCEICGNIVEHPLGDNNND